MGYLQSLVPASLFALLALSASAHAQDQKKFLEEERRKEMDDRPRPDEDLHQAFLWDAGAWLHAQYDLLNDRPFRTTRVDRYFDLRLWGEVWIDRTYTAYARLETDYTDFNAGDQYAGTVPNQYPWPHVDQAWIGADYTDSGRGFSIRVGREFISMGSGLLYNDLAYAVQATFAADGWAVRGWVGHTIIHEADIDQSLPHPSTTRRGFFGLESDILITGNHRAYALFLLEHDFNGEDIPVQKWDYNANYLGVGARGTIWGGWGYSAEGDLEFGRTSDAASTMTDAILAFAFLLTTDYQFPGSLEPAIRLQYMFASGDRDRTSVTDTVAGNQAGTTDTGFLAFGFVQTGFSLFPRVANVHLFSLGGSMRPLEDIEALHKLEIGVFGYYYRKAIASELISDSRSFLANADIGREVDFVLRWRIFSDLGVSLNYGCFFPGQAYTDRTPRHFLSTGVTYSF